MRSRRRPALTLMLALVPLPARAQQAGQSDSHAPEKYELHTYDLTAILTRLSDAPPPTIELSLSHQMAWRQLGASFRLTEPRTVFIGEKMIENFVKETVAPGTWEQGQASISLTPQGRLWVNRPPEVHQKVASALAYLRHEATREVAVEATLALVEDAILDEWRAKAPGMAILSDEAARALAEALSKGQRAARVHTLRALARNAQQVNPSALTDHAYVQDYDMQHELGGGVSADPIMGYLRLGAVLGVRPIVVGDRLVAEVRYAQQDGKLPIPRFDTGIEHTSALGLPEVTYTAVESTIACRVGQTVLAGRIEVADPAVPEGTPGRSLCLFLRATLVPREPVPFPIPDKESRLRLFDVRTLTEEVQDFPGPSLNLVKGPGVDEKLREPQPLLPPKELLDLIKCNVAMESWDHAGNTIDDDNGFLIVRNDPPVLDRVRRYLDELAERRARMVTTRVDVLAAEPAAYEALVAKLPALGMGTARLGAAEAAELLARAAKGEGGLSLAASAEVAGMSGQRVTIQRLGQQAYVRDYDIELSGSGSVPDPQVDVISDGLVLDCRSRVSDDGKLAEVDLRATYARLERPIPVLETKEKSRKLQTPSLAAAPFRAMLAGTAGEVLVVGSGGPVKLGGTERHLLAIVRCRPAP